MGRKSSKLHFLKFKLRYLCIKKLHSYKISVCQTFFILILVGNPTKMHEQMDCSVLFLASRAKGQKDTKNKCLVYFLKMAQ